MKKKKVLFVATVVKIHIMVFHIPYLEWFKKQGYEVHVAASNDYENKEDCNIPFCDKFFDLPFERQPLKKNNIKVGKQLEKIIEDNAYDIIHCHTPMGGILGRWAARNSTSKVLYTAHGFHFYDGAPLKNWLFLYPAERFYSRFTDVLITINEEDYKRAQTFKAKQVKYIPGVGIDLNDIQINEEKVSNLKKELKFTPNDFVLCSIGELNRNKNHNIVLEALNKINNKHIKYVVAGEGNLRENLTKKVRELNLEKQVTFLGFSNDIYELLFLSDIFIFPSYREGLSKSLMEAMAMGKPIIASDIRGNKDLIVDETGGLLFEPRNADQLAKYILLMMNNELFRDSASLYNQEKVKQFSIENVLNEMSKIY